MIFYSNLKDIIILLGRATLELLVANWSDRRSANLLATFVKKFFSTEYQVISMFQ